MVTKVKNSTLEATISVVNVGTGMDVLVNEAPSQQSVLAKSIKAGTNVTITNDGATLTINSTASGGTGGITGATNAGTGTGVASGVSGTSLVLKSLKAGPNISITSTADEITVEATGSASGEANTASNVGTGVGVFKSKTGVNLALKTLKAGANITLTPSADEVLIEASGSGATPFADISAYGAIGDFVPAAGSTGTGTNNDAAINSAIASNKPLWIPAGNFLVTSAVQAALNNTTTTGPGTLWINTNVGITKFGKMLSIGSTRSHEMQSVGGIKLGGESGDGFRWYMGHHNWSQIQPTKYGAPTQFQLYPSVVCGLATTTSPNVLNAVHGSFDASRMTVGDHIGFGNEVFKIASFVSSTQITVTKFDGSSPSFNTNTTQRTFYHAYEIAQGTCNVNGTTVTYLSGEQYPFGVSQDHMYAIINGTKYNVASGPESVGTNFLTLASSAGTLSNATIEFRRCWGYWAYVTLLRLQGLGGGIETNCGLYLNIRNEAVLFNSGYGSTYYGDMRVNANKIYLGCGDGTGGTESMEIGSDYNSLGGLYGSESVRVHKVPGGTANRIDIIGGASSFAPAITMRSSTEANQSLGFDLQGNGTFRFTAGSFGRNVTEIYAPAGTNTWPTLAAGVAEATFSVNSALSNVDLVLAPKGSGLVKITSNPWVYFSFQNGWTDAVWGLPCGFRFDPGGRIVRFRGMISGGSNGTLIGYLPIALRPPNTIFLGTVGASLTPAGIQIFSDGRMYGFGSGSPVGQICLDGLTFPLDS